MDTAEMSTVQPVQYVNEALDAIEHFDTPRAFILLRNLDRILGMLSQQISGDPSVINGLRVLGTRLRCTAFPELPLEEACQMLSAEVSSFYRENIDLNERMSVRYVYAGYDKKETERVALRGAILSNHELIGGGMIGGWLESFEKAFPATTRPESAVMDYFQTERRVGDLSKDEQAQLKSILSVYDRWLSSPLVDVYDIAYVWKNRDHLQSVGESSRTPGSGSDSGQSYIAMPLLPAFAKFVHLNEQPITGVRLKLQSQSDPIRPTLGNWIKVYREELGVGLHTPLVRGQFLFQSTNGKSLSSEERERINLIIKSLEENFPLSIDAERQEIVFPVWERVEAPRAAGTPAVTASMRTVAVGNMQRPVPETVVPRRAEAAPVMLKSVPTPTFHQEPFPVVPRSVPVSSYQPVPTPTFPNNQPVSTPSFSVRAPVAVEAEQPAVSRDAVRDFFAPIPMHVPPTSVPINPAPPISREMPNTFVPRMATMTEPAAQPLRSVPPVSSMPAFAPSGNPGSPAFIAPLPRVLPNVKPAPEFREVSRPRSVAPSLPVRPQPAAAPLPAPIVEPVLPRAEMLGTVSFTSSHTLPQEHREERPVPAPKPPVVSVPVISRMNVEPRTAPIVPRPKPVLIPMSVPSAPVIPEPIASPINAPTPVLGVPQASPLSSSAFSQSTFRITPSSMREPIPLEDVPVVSEPVFVEPFHPGYVHTPPTPVQDERPVFQAPPQNVAPVAGFNPYNIHPVGANYDADDDMTTAARRAGVSVENVVNLKP